MARHIIFLVHGMGDFKAGWSAPLQQLIRNLYQQYRGPSLLVPFDANFVFQEIHYNDLFDDRRQAWQAHADAVIGALTEQGLQSSAAGLLARYAQETNKEAFLATHVLDVLLYRFIPQIAQQVRTRVQKQILETLKQQPHNEIVEWSIVAHSLGTSVSHDTLHAMYTHQAGGQPLPANVTRAKGLTLLANVSRILETDADVYTSVVHPSADPAQGVCDYFLNARHEWDPIPVPRQFRPVDDWPDLATRCQNRFRNIAINAIQAPNVHGFDHYLSNPKVHIPLFRTFTWDALIDETTEQAAIDRFETATPLGQFKQHIKQIKRLWPSERANWRQIIKTYRDYQDLVRQATT